MKLDDFLSELEKLIRSLKRDKNRVIESTQDRNRLRAVGDAWLYDVRSEAVTHVPPNGAEQLSRMDHSMQGVLEATYRRITASRYAGLLEEFRQAAVRLRVLSAVGGPSPAPGPSGESQAVLATLERLNPAVADSYAQALHDLDDPSRLSLRGTANQLREVLREVLEVLAPDELVVKETWYSPHDDSGRTKAKPSYADRTKYALIQRGKGKNAQRQTAASVERADELLGSIVRSTYARGSGATHTETERREIVGQLRFTNAILLELLE